MISTTNVSILFGLILLMLWCEKLNASRQVVLTCGSDEAAEKGAQGAPGKRGPVGPPGRMGQKGFYFV